jgi:lysylphosphatidylglycerol synthetase-like protein (DUF2156 family)
MPVSGWTRGGNQLTGPTTYETLQQRQDQYARELLERTSKEGLACAKCAEIATRILQHPVARRADQWLYRQAEKGLARAAEFGIRAYNQLRSAIKGTGLQEHHVIDQRFAGVMGQNAREMASVAVTRAEHQAFTNAWRARIPYGPSGTGAAT